MSTEKAVRRRASAAPEVGGNRWRPRAAIGVVAVPAIGLLAVLFAVLRDVLDEKVNQVDTRIAQGQLILGALTGLLTLVIAGATAWYARLTAELVQNAEATREDVRSEIELAKEQLDVSRRQIDASGEQVELGRASLLVATRPIIADVPTGQHLVGPQHPGVRFASVANPIHIADEGQPFAPDATPDFAYLWLPVRNVGAGLAIIESSYVACDVGPSFPGELGRTVLPPGERTGITFAVPRKGRPELEELVSVLTGRREVSVSITYANATGGDQLRTRLDLVSDHSAPTNMRVRRAAFFVAGEEHPFASSGPAEAT